MSKLQHIIHQIPLKALILAVLLSTLFIGNVKPAQATGSSTAHSSSSTLATCPDVEVIFIHGAASDVTDSKDVSAWHDTFYSQLSSLKNLQFDYYHLGEATYDGARYDGADIGIASLTEIKNTVETYFSAGKTGEFNATVKTGLTELSGRIREVRAMCTNTKFVFGGYSEGAYILHKFFSENASSLGLTPDNVVYIATFGDPKLYLPEGEGANPPACRNEAFSGYRVYAPNCHAHSGILGASKPDYFPASQINNAGLWCTKKDVMCSNYFDIFNLAHIIDDHLNYADKEPYPYQQAAILVRQKLASIFPDKVKATESVHPAARDTAILIDTTGSMASIIEKYKAEALKVAKTTIEAGGRIALFEYRDLSADGKEYVPHQLCDFSCTYAEFSEKISDLEPAGGGDTPESALSASLGVLNKLSWQKGATKSLVLLTDAVYHDADFDGTTLSDVVKRSLEIDPVNFYIVAPDSVKSAYSSLAAQTGGNLFSLSDADIKLSGKTLLSRPDLNFQFESYSLKTDEVATFLVDTYATDIDHFEWDLDFDGIFEVTTASPAISTLYNTPSTGFIQAKVVTTSGLSSTASALVTVSANAEDLGPAPEITDIAITTSKDAATVTIKKSAALSVIFIDDYAIGLTSESTFTVTDLENGEHTLTLAPVSSTGLRGESVTKTFTIGKVTNIPTAPNTGKPY